MKTLFTIFVLSLALRLSGLAATALLPAIPAPTLTVVQAVAVAQKQIKDDPAYVLVSVQWCLSKSFQPPVSDGTQYTATDDVDDYSWFVTYVYRDEQMAKLESGIAPENSKYNSVLVIRIKKNGSVGGLIGARA